MPKQYPTSSIVFDLSFAGPSTIEEYSATPGADIVGDAVRGLIAWDTLPEWMEAFAPKFAEAFNVTRQVNEKATAEAKARSKNPDSIKPTYETVTRFVKREYATLTPEQQLEAKKLAQSVADTITIDPSPAKKGGKPKADLLAKADSWLQLDDESLEAKITKASSEPFNVTRAVERDGDGRPERESLARFIGDYLDALLAQQ